MNIITEPEVYMVGKQTVVAEELDRFLADHHVSTWETDTEVAGQKLVEVGGRVCYMSFSKPRPGGNKAYLDHIIEVGHGSVLEHAAWNFIITGVSRSFTHELVRHRAGWAYSQLSQRYVDESVAEYVVPHDLREEVAAAQYRRTLSQGADFFDMAAIPTYIASHNRWNKYKLSEFQAMADAGEAWLKSVEHAHSAYTKLADYLAKKGPVPLDCGECDGLGCTDGALKCGKCEGTGKTKLAPTDVRKFARQAARSVLPNATETKIFVTANARSLRHFIEMRASRFAEPEIRKVAVAILNIMQKEAPGFFGDYTLTALPDGTYEANTEHRKV